MSILHPNGIRLLAAPGRLPFKEAIRSTVFQELSPALANAERVGGGGYI
jgi:hypothetical protein